MGRGSRLSTPASFAREPGGFKDGWIPAWIPACAGMTQSHSDRAFARPGSVRQIVTPPETSITAPLM